MAMETNTELELDIQHVKAVLQKCSCFYKDTSQKLANTDKIISSRKNFVFFQFRNIFDPRMWF